MPVAFKKMTWDEKLRAMEALWSDLCADGARLPDPQWQKDVLADREHLIREGKAKFIDWDIAKKRIARRTK